METAFVLSAEQLTRYCERIGIAGPLRADLATLRRLHARHLATVPFENLDRFLGRPIVLDEALVVEKIVDARRGGFCYELNGAFAALLRTLGFPVILLSAGVAREGGWFGPPYDHLTLEVTVEGHAWLVDVGFGRGPIEPLALDRYEAQTVCEETYRTVSTDAGIVVEMWNPIDVWQPQYRLQRAPEPFEAFAPMCAFHHGAAESPFARGRIVSLTRAGERLTLSDDRFVRTQADGARSESVLCSADAYAQVLRDAFGIDLMPPETHALFAGIVSDRR